MRLLHLVVAGRAQRLQVRGSEEQSSVPTMRFDVVDVAACDPFALRRMHPAPGLAYQMLGPELAPSRRRVEYPPWPLDPALGVVATVALALCGAGVHLALSKNCVSGRWKTGTSVRERDPRAPPASMMKNLSSEKRFVRS